MKTKLARSKSLRWCPPTERRLPPNALLADSASDLPPDLSSGSMLSKFFDVLAHMLQYICAPSNQYTELFLVALKVTTLLARRTAPIDVEKHVLRSPKFERFLGCVASCPNSFIVHAAVDFVSALCSFRSDTGARMRSGVIERALDALSSGHDALVEPSFLLECLIHAGGVHQAPEPSAADKAPSSSSSSLKLRKTQSTPAYYPARRAQVACAARGAPPVSSIFWDRASSNRLHSRSWCSAS